MAALLLLGVLAGAMIAVPGAAAEAPVKFWKSCLAGSEAGQCIIPRGIGADPNVPGHVYIANQSNFRIEEFDAWGVFVKAWGWGVASGNAELQSCGPGADPPTVSCQKGLEGAGAGQFGLFGPQGVTVDEDGSVYVVDQSNRRVQKFDPEGNFLLMFGGGVNQGPLHPGNVCTAQHIVEGDTCGAGTTGTAAGQFGVLRVGSYIALSPSGTIYVGDQERIQEFEADGSFKAQIPLAGETVQSLATDPAGNLYLSLFNPSTAGSKDNVWKLGSTGTELCTPTKSNALAVKNPRAIATDRDGNVYVVETGPGPGGGSKSRVQQFNPDCTDKKEPFGEDELTQSTGIEIGWACHLVGGGLYASSSELSNSFVRGYDLPPLPPHPDNSGCPAPEEEPDIEDQFGLSADTEGAVVRAEINPYFQVDTRYYVEYGTGKCSEGGCPNQKPLAPGALLTSTVTKDPVPTKAVFVSGLEPDTQYHYRFVAQNSGGQVFGVDPDGRGIGEKATFEKGLEVTFTTFPPRLTPKDNCPNQAFRTGPSANLPDCRAFEMVSPIEKANADIATHGNIANYQAELDQSAISGDKLTYSSLQAFADAMSAPLISQYIATRGAGGWSTHAINAPREGVSFTQKEGQDTRYKAFSSDLCEALMLQDIEPQLAPEAQPGFVNPYRRTNCSEESYEALLVVPPKQPSKEFLPEIQGHSAVFRVDDQLSGDASSDLTINQLYQFHDGEDDLLSVLPGGIPCETHASAGSETPAATRGGRAHNVRNAVSENGQLIYFSCGSTLYLRKIDTQETVSVSSGPAQFWSAARDGSRAIFNAGEDLYEYDAASESVIPIATKVKGILGTSEDATRVYPVSTDVLSGTEENSEDDVAQAGKPNLYLLENGVFHFVATLSGEDAALHIPSLLSPINVEPVERTSRVAPDGLSAAFMSNASLTGYDNTDANSGEADAEVFLYDAQARGGEGELVCASCNPSEVRPSGRELLSANKNKSGLWAAAQIPSWENSLYATRALSDSGQRLFFESFEALVTRDTNGRQDVYQWERAGSEEECEEEIGGELFLPANEGCLSLISSGESPTDSEFLDANPSGSDLFFKTGESLLIQDPSLVDIYDAREGGGYPPPPVPEPPCQGGNCQAPSAAPDDPTPASSSFQAAGNPPPPVKCPKGKRPVRRGGKTLCVPRKNGKKGKRRSSKARGAKRQGGERGR